MKFFKAGLSFVLCALSACASPQPAAENSPACTQKPQPEIRTAEQPKPPAKMLEDRSTESDYELSAFATRFEMADTYARAGKRAAGAVVLSGVKLKLDANATRERLFIDLKTAEVWGCEGHGRDAEKARSMIATVQAAVADDARLLADASLALCVVTLADGDWANAEFQAIEALAQYEKAQAHRRYVEACRFALRRFLSSEEPATARKFAALGYARICEIDALPLRCLMALDCALLEFKTGTSNDAARFLEDAYAAANKADNRWLRNSVIAAAVGELAALRLSAQVVIWGDRLRDATYGKLPTQAASALDPFTYARALAQYALAGYELSPNSPRSAEALEVAKVGLDQVFETAESLEIAELAALKVLSEKVENALLKTAGG